mmetsp:Transcript_90916/g.252955  ORF Transcript_90916/g.252955 Transcript_90916/m.252955 type:complete len:121 (+) Transcript_90916:134-496(+)
MLFQGESMVGPPGDSEKADSAMLFMESVRAVLLLRRLIGERRALGDRFSFVVSEGPGERLPRRECPAEVMDSARAAKPRGGECGDSKCTRVLSEGRRERMRNKRLMGTPSSGLGRRPQHI